MASIKLKQVVKQYTKDGPLVVDNVDLEIMDNEFLVLVGPSGCGKSTTLRMIAGLEEITSGEMYIGEKLVNDLPPKDRNISMVFQNYALYPHLTVAQNLGFGLKIQIKDKEELKKRVEAMAELLELTPLLDRKPALLSGGQRQRVAMGRAMIRETDVLLMDEPLSNLDAKLRVQVRSEILDLHDKIPRTVVYVTHDQVEAMTMGDRIAVFYNGVVQQIDKPDIVFEKPRNLFVAGFMGSPPMNLFDCIIEEENGKLYAKNDDFKISLPERLHTEKIRNQVGKQSVLGVRPDEIMLETDDAEFEATVEVIQFLGTEEMVSIRTSDTLFYSKMQKKITKKMDDKIGVKFIKDRIHIFDKESELNISI